MNETVITADRINSTKFEYMDASQSFVVEASELPKGFSPHKQIWNDSTDVGFIMVSHKTSQKLIFIQTEVEMYDGDVEAWNFVATPEGNDNQITFPLNAVIIND